MAVVISWKTFKSTTMKKTALLILMSLSVALISCSKSDDNNPSPSDTSSSVKENVPGQWKVSYYYDNDKEETSNYLGYTFTFASDGTLTAINAAQTYQGSWSNTVDDNLPRLVISLSGNDDLIELSDDWVIKSISNTLISLEDDNTTKTEQLKFSKVN